MKKEEIIIREIQPYEYPLMKEFIYEAVYQPDPNNPYPKELIYYPEIRIYWDDWNTKKDDYCLISLIDDKPIGAVWIRTFHGVLKGYGYIDENTPELSIAIFPEYRNKGIGTNLMNQMIRLMITKGFKKVSLSITKGNKAIHLYNRLGFKVVNESENDYIMLMDLR